MMNKLQTKFKKMQNKKGFTLIELIVVIVIIGILAAIIVPRLGGFGDRANEAAIAADQRTIETAVAVYYAENDKYPGSDTGVTWQDDLIPTYLNKEPSSATFSVNATTGAVTYTTD